MTLTPSRPLAPDPDPTDDRALADQLHAAARRVRAELGKRTVKELRAMVVQHNLHTKISGHSWLRKSALITAILKHKGGPDDSDEDSDDDMVPCDGGGLPTKKKLKGACHGGSCVHDEKHSDVLE